ncbi:MAG: hypothetical protein JWN45_3064 [Acidobacteriaceae bacterium]|nr:hypothetical protein [Acidobacteriaceae bacterium]
MTAHPRSTVSVRTTIVLIAALLLLASFAPKMLRARAESSDENTINISAAGAGPREVEETTQKAIQRQYSAAWKNMAVALKENRTDLLDQSFVGSVRDQLAKEIEQQKKTGISTRYIDRGHQVNVVFYSPEGTALELRDTADIEHQVLDGIKVIHSEQLRQQYLVIFTLVEDKWKVRIMQAVPGA